MSNVDFLEQSVNELYDMYSMWCSKRDQCFDALLEPSLLPAHKACLCRLAIEFQDEADTIYPIL